MRFVRMVFALATVVAFASVGWAATELLKDVRPGVQSGNSDEFVYLKTDTYVLNGNDGVAGKELWISNGTTAGTQLLADINPGPGDSDPSGLIAVGPVEPLQPPRLLQHTTKNSRVSIGLPGPMQLSHQPGLPGSSSS